MALGDEGKGKALIRATGTQRSLSEALSENDKKPASVWSGLLV
jgi:hypothetical protein